jgi:hypothetical protein
MRTKSRVLRHAALAGIVASAFVAACGWDPSHPFEREAPPVKEAISHLDGGDARAASTLLEDYLSTGVCKDGNIGTPPAVRARSNGSFDLGLGLFRIGEAYGRKFGDEEVDAGLGGDPTLGQQRKEQVDCALRIVRAVAEDRDQPLDLRARARYLEGNLLFLTGDYEDAVSAYDAALELAPGMTDAGPIGAADAGRPFSPDLLGRDAAWNRAIALRRIEDKKDAGKDGSPDAQQDSGGDGGQDDDKKDGGDQNDSGKDGGGDGGGGGDAGQDSGKKNDQPDAGDDSNSKPKPKDQPPPKEPEQQPASRQNQDERMLDQLENAPTVQQEAAKKAGRKRVRGMTDK